MKLSTALGLGASWLAPSLLIAALGAAAAGAQPLELREGDRVVLLGGTLVEREQAYGDWELRLSLAFPTRRIEFRNLGWSGDTVGGVSRAYFDPPEKGYANLLALVSELKPSVVLLAYGQAEAFDGPAGLAPFEAGLNRLLDDLARLGPRLVLITPPRAEVRPPPLPDLTAYNRDLAAVADRIRATGAARKLPVVDLFARSAASDGRLTDNGLHLSARGYEVTAGWLAEELQLPAPPPLSAAERSALRQAIVAKNELFFHRWRPQNQTYLFGFRKHEQGQNAQEVAQFDPLVAAAEQRIAALLRGPAN